MAETERERVPLAQLLRVAEEVPDREERVLPEFVRDGVDDVDILFDAVTEKDTFIVTDFSAVTDVVVVPDGLCDTVAQPEGVADTDLERLPLAQALFDGEVLPVVDTLGLVVEERDGLVLPLVVFDTDDVAVKVLLATEPVGEAVEDVETLNVAVVVNVPFTVPEDMVDGDAVAVPDELCDSVEQLDGENDTVFV